MRKLRITAPARSDQREIRRYTVERYGRRAADAYDSLIKQAVRDLLEDPYRPGSKERPEIARHIRSYHTTLSRGRAEGKIKAPRHLVLYFVSREDVLVVSRILHDSRDLARHVPADHLKEAKGGSKSPRGGHS